ncbi:hypothetical protein [Paranoxybacillus vitaminiphilus]|nr:hypothetical protein [Anoxybacillus vitaminiphilus]
MGMNVMNRGKRGTLGHLEFLKERVYGITDMTRTNKLSEILNRFADEPTSEIYVIQNTKNKKASAVLSDVEYFEHLLDIKEFFEQIVDDYMYQVASERQNDTVDIPLEVALEGEEFEFDEIIQLAHDIEMDDEE